jgi:hypothetical protein
MSIRLIKKCFHDFSEVGEESCAVSFLLWAMSLVLWIDGGEHIWNVNQ